MPALMVRYGELGLKSSSVRRRFEHALVQDIQRKHALAGVQCVITSQRGRIFVDSDDWRRSCEILSKTFGVVSFSPIERCSSGLETILDKVLEFSAPLLTDGCTFAVRTRRTGNHPYTSKTLAEALGAKLLEAHENKKVSVDLDEPDVEIHVEVREKDAYLYSLVLRGPGGMPRSTQGRILSVVDRPAGIASSWLMMKRGCHVLVATAEKGLANPLRVWDPDLKVVEPDYDLLALASSMECSGLALPYTFRDLERAGAVKGDLPVFYPLVGMQDDEIAALIERVMR